RLGGAVVVDERIRGFQDEAIHGGGLYRGSERIAIRLDFVFKRAARLFFLRLALPLLWFTIGPFGVVPRKSLADRSGRSRQGFLGRDIRSESEQAERHHREQQHPRSWHERPPSGRLASGGGGGVGTELGARPSRPHDAGGTPALRFSSCHSMQRIAANWA